MSTKEVICDDRYLWLLAVGEQGADRVHIPGWCRKGPRERVADPLVDDAEKYDGSYRELLELLSR